MKLGVIMKNIAKTILMHVCASACLLNMASAMANTQTVGTSQVLTNTAGAVDYVLGVSNIVDFPSQEMARLRIEQVGADTKWTLSVNWNDVYNVTAPFVQSLNFSMTAGQVTQKTLPLFDVMGAVGVKSFGSTGIDFISANSNNRLSDGERASWVFTNTNLVNFVVRDLHVNSIFNGQSVKFTPVTVVPEPATYAMLLLGIAGLTLMSSKKRQDRKTVF